MAFGGDVRASIASSSAVNPRGSRAETRLRVLHEVPSFTAATTIRNPEAPVTGWKPGPPLRRRTDRRGPGRGCGVAHGKIHDPQ